MIDKSREDLAQIDLKFKSSLVELRSRSGCKNKFHISWKMKSTIHNELYSEGFSEFHGYMYQPSSLVPCYQVCKINYTVNFVSMQIFSVGHQFSS